MSTVARAPWRHLRWDDVLWVSLSWCCRKGYKHVLKPAVKSAWQHGVAKPCRHAGHSVLLVAASRSGVLRAWTAERAQFGLFTTMVALPGGDRVPLHLLPAWDGDSDLTAADLSGRTVRAQEPPRTVRATAERMDRQPTPALGRREKRLRRPDKNAPQTCKCGWSGRERDYGRHVIACARKDLAVLHDIQDALRLRAEHLASTTPKKPVDHTAEPVATPVVVVDEKEPTVASLKDWTASAQVLTAPNIHHPSELGTWLHLAANGTTPLADSLQLLADQLRAAMVDSEIVDLVQKAVVHALNIKSAFTTSSKLATYLYANVPVFALRKPVGQMVDPSGWAKSTTALAGLLIEHPSELGAWLLEAAEPKQLLQNHMLLLLNYLEAAKVPKQVMTLVESLPTDARGIGSMLRQAGKVAEQEYKRLPTFKAAS